MKESPEKKLVPKQGGIWDRIRKYFDHGDVFVSAEKPEVVEEPLDPVVSDNFDTDAFPTTEATINSAEEIEVTPEALVQTYNKRLEALRLEARGNPNLKETISRNITAWEATGFPDIFLSLVNFFDISFVELEQLFQKRTEELLQKCEFFRATNVDVFLYHIINGERRYKSQFETGTSNGSLAPLLRSREEKRLLGFPEYDLPEGEEAVMSRPIYGYLSLNPHGVLNTEGRHPPKNVVTQYGTVSVKIKRRVAMERSTVSLCDSLRLAQNTPLSPAALPHYSCLFHQGKSNDFWENRNELIAFLQGSINNYYFMAISERYTEVQYHGGLTVDDIDSVHLSLGNGLDQEEINEVTAAVEAYNRETGNTIPVVIY